ncbi:hypothetical protein FHW69_000514 [Luteibacter sp. Sphag1AF]|uniref:hypothetical protein n=1 Tax=Luteibacter sp. Sphag1AF TaxID=2587031 RepID=UPI00161DD6E5|nr:hypothetical protein [Luteibacter sp. Sphag1AF]MBB3225924.1 hypothetical protein [Luteibacter sp. Sphag1AF]
MNARTQVFALLCVVGATGTVAAQGVDLTGNLLSLSGSAAASHFEGNGSDRFDGGNTRGNQGGRGRDSGDVMSSRASANQRIGNPSVPSGVDGDDNGRDSAPAPTARSQNPSWQSLLPGAML